MIGDHRSGGSASSLPASTSSGWATNWCERNYRTRAGEIDLILIDGATLVFCEVKTLIARSQAGGPSSPFECIRPGKRLQVRRMARSWLSERPPGSRGFSELRFDAVGVTLTLAGRTLRVEHLPNAF